MTASTITLLIYIFLLVPLMLLGYYFARRKMYIPHHKLVMTLVVILNWILIAVVMVVSYAPIASSLPDSLNNRQSIIATIHGSVGLIAQLVATYLVLLMWTEGTRFRYIVIYRIKNIKTPMRFTLSLWIITVLLGFGVYGVWYGDNTLTNGESPSPAITEEVTSPPENTETVIEPVITEDTEITETIASPSTTEEHSAPAMTEQVTSAPEPATTEQPAPPAITEDVRATEDAIEEATDIAEDLYDDLTDIAEDMTDDAEDLYDDMTDDAEDRDDDDDDD